MLLNSCLTPQYDGISAAYRLRQGALEDAMAASAMAASMAKSGGYSDGRYISVVCNRPGENGPTVLSMMAVALSQQCPGCSRPAAVGDAQQQSYNIF